MLTSKYKSPFFALCLAATFCLGTFSACGKDPAPEEIQDESSGSAESESLPAQSDSEAKDEENGNLSTANDTKESAPEGSGAQESDADASDGDTQTAEDPEIAAMFGENCITSQTFEVTLSEFDGAVWFVPYYHYPSEDQVAPFIQIIQDGEVLSWIRRPQRFMPESLSGQRFLSLDEVSFTDVNFDGITDVILIETYENAAFATICYGEVDDYDDRVYFHSQEDLSENVTANAETLTASGVRDYVTGGKENGQFESYQDAYQTMARIKAMESANKPVYDLIYVDDDEVPELVSDHPGYFVSLYTYHDGSIYVLMDEWGYGAFGNHGYDYAPRKNSLYNFDTDGAGAILNDTYMAIGEDHSLKILAMLTSYNYDDENGNGMPDEEEWGADTYQEGTYRYVDGEYVLVSEDEWKKYHKGEYEPISGCTSLDELLAELTKSNTP